MKIVIKISSNLLNPSNPVDIIEKLAEEIAILKKEKNDFIIVTSGAVMHGMKKLNISKKPDNIPMLQSCASIGQIELMSRYKNVFNKYELIPGEILLSTDDFKIRNRYLNLRNTIKTLINIGVIPVINENDTINIEELKFGDNDHLSSLISIMFDFDMLILLTDVNGLYKEDPKTNPDAELITSIDNVNSNIIGYATNKTSNYTTGGMKNKIINAGKACRAGVKVFIGNGYNVSIQKIIQGIEIGTYINPKLKMKSKMKWIAFSPQNKGTIFIDSGAKNALIEKRASLLPSGIISCDGKFNKGDLVNIVFDNEVIGKGLVNYSNSQINLIKGKKSDEVKNIVSDYYEEVIHRNNMFIL